ncbi:SbcC/MukB-like Walker B domain-containing protein [Marinilactibacillus kalidii]|uniref:SbcC/MukB-like Walker B domain-containing protein n=1 Tax=Marinilactibacillus kalidii TaxID=2820274 RepID=UPI001ABDAC39|nr:SMC family ATPase [Marinilactibacillus kalidii]
MRPLKLVMNAFGPYKEKVEIDFTTLAQSSLFLVSGPTGAGKTTIFDAIAYALFDQASGDTRQKDTFKSQFAKDTDLSFVELAFELGEKCYFIHREPTQIGPGTRSKTKQIQSNVEFHHGEQVTTKVKEANEEIQRIIGLTYDQFRQIVMLPQGSFKKMLESDSGDKEKIFRNIFQTKQIEQFQALLKIKAKQLEDQYKSSKQAMEQAFSTIAIKEDQELEKAIEQFDVNKILERLTETIAEEEAELGTVRETLSTLQKELKEKEQILEWLAQKEKITAERESLEANHKTIQQKEVALKQHDEAEKIVQAETELQEVAKQVTTQTSKLTALKETVQQLEVEEKRQLEKQVASKAAVDTLKQLRKTVSALQEEIKRFDQVEAKESLLKQQAEKIKNEQDKQSKLSEQLVLTNEKIEKAEKELALMQKLQTKIEELKEKVLDTKERLQASSSLEEQLAAICKLQQTEQKSKNEVEAAKQLSDIAYRKLVTGKADYFANLASRLAEELGEEEACPVCGSTHHPSLATISETAVTEEQIEALEQEEKQTNAKAIQLEAQLENVRQDIANRSESIAIDPATAATVYEETKLQKQSLEIEMQGFVESLETAEQQMLEEAKVKEQLTMLKEEAQESKINQQQVMSTIAFTETRMQELSEELEQLKAPLSGESKLTIQTEIETKEQAIDKIEQTHEAIQKALSEISSQLASTKTAIELTTSQLEETSQRKSRLNKLFEELKSASDLSEPFSDYVLSESNQQSYAKEVETHKQAVLVNKDRHQQIEQQLNQVAALEDKKDYEEATAQITIEYQKLEQERDERLMSTAQNKRAKETISMYHKQSGEAEKEYQLYGRLADLANGTKQTDYISFERYVLGIYFEEILLAANQRFNQMTNNRYELKRQLERGKGSGKQGLDMEVFDHYTGKSRSVHTLSGGETFKASLALALGLSDVIQNQNGGVSVDTLFVDEGFGTLDSDSLDMAVQTLLDLHQKGRLVGIISHVDELKTRIPAHIVVEKTATGSTAYIQQ